MELLLEELNPNIMKIALLILLYVISLLGFFVAFRTKLDKESNNYYFKRSSKYRLLALSSFFQIIAISYTYLLIFGCNEGGHLLGC
ncbi:hypothetical protein [Pedobacter helvus]|uniref:Uncharacterized protein n=1 Tax=Pedobacter helvus TaxID=2563444 RepID=A0ABW9JJW0_9SPHI|nr:hypothetical protein [Pedobacter ureilyticus]